MGRHVHQDAVSPFGNCLYSYPLGMRSLYWLKENKQRENKQMDQFIRFLYYLIHVCVNSLFQYAWAA